MSAFIVTADPELAYFGETYTADDVESALGYHHNVFGQPEDPVPTATASPTIDRLVAAHARWKAACDEVSRLARDGESYDATAMAERRDAYDDYTAALTSAGRGLLSELGLRP